MPDENDERPHSISPYDYSDKSIRHACIAVLAYLALRALSAVIGAVQQPALANWFAIDLAVAVIGLGGDMGVRVQILTARGAASVSATRLSGARSPLSCWTTLAI